MITLVCPPRALVCTRIEEEKHASEIMDHKCTDSHNKTMAGKNDKNNTEPEAKGHLEGLETFGNYFPDCQ